MDTETVQMLGFASNLAAMTGQEKESIEIAEAVAAALPDSEDAEMLRVNAYLHAARYQEAEKMLRDGLLASRPDNLSAKAMLGLALHGAGKKSERDRVLEEVIAGKPNDENALLLAESLHNL